MTKLLPYLFLVTLSLNAFGQKKNSIAAGLAFQDSVRVILENTRNVDAGVIGNAFISVWNSLPLDQQQKIQRQAYALRKKKFSLKPHIINYFGAIVNAVNVERIDQQRFNEFLDVCGKVIETYAPAKAANFLSRSRTFFQYHALHYEKSFRLYPKDDQYRFEFIEPPKLLDWNDTTQTSDATLPQPSDDQMLASLDAPIDTSFSQTYMPSWMTPPPPPSLEGPVLRFDAVTLNMVTRYDSVFVKGTKGSLSLIDNTFVGEGGSFDWSPAGLSADSVFCNFTTYTLNVTRSSFKSDLVKLSYVGRTPGFVPGNFEFQSQARRDSVISTYPRFRSYQSDLEINGMADNNVKYKGGFSLIGNKISSQSASGDLSTIEVFHEGERKFIAQSPNFTFTKSTINSEKTKVKILQRNDSIVHQRVRMKYMYGDSLQTLILLKDKGEMKNAPYASTFFNIDFAADVLKWNLYTDSLDLLTDGGRNTVPLIVESVDYYDLEDYRLLKGVGFNYHPLALVANYCLKKRVRQFYSGDLAMYSKLSPTEIKKGIEFLAQKGMVIYNPRTDLVEVKEKTIVNYKAFKGEIDYDNIKIHSVIDSFPNASINFDKGYMTVRGVEEFNVSDSLNVNVKPDSSTITLLQNRDIKFDGTINAGNFEISGKGFTLKYDSFFINLTRIDSINFYVIEKNARGQEVRRKINNSLVGNDSTSAAAAGLSSSAQKSGTLFINRANNKSGKQRIPNYPRLDASAGGVIYFDRKEVLGGVYDRSMFFVVPPFKLDSLNDADPASINFDGTFVSSGMFPNFKEKLHTQPDKSLGFSHAIPRPGYQLYKGDGNMNGVLNMDHRGLRGYGDIKYLAAHISSPDFIFYPDSVVAKGSRATIAQKQFGAVLFPQASLPDYDMKWYPKQDQMTLKNLKAPFNFYDSTAQMYGTITVSKNGVAGAGKFETRGTELISRNMKFTGNDFSARHARFKVKTADPDKPLFTGNDVRLKFDLKENHADISPEVQGVAAIDFPYAQFKTSIPNARWDLDEQRIVMRKDPNTPLENSYFYTTRKELDSLHFNADRAEYDLKKQELKVSGIPYIIVADAKITPQNNEVLILENARIGTLKNTTIILDTLNGYHRLTEGVVDIISRKEFSGYATYQYVNLLNDTFAIKMTDFHLEPIEQTGTTKKSRRNSVATMQTVATGAVAAQDNLVLGAGLYYKGDMIMYATRPALQLSGYVKMDIRNIKDYNAWIRYSQSGEETEVLIDFANAVTEEGKRASAGLHFGSADNDLYLTFFNDKKSDEDDDFFTPAGMLGYDKDHNEYRVEDREKAAGNKLEGKVFGYNDETRQVRFEGPVNLFNGTKDFNVTTSVIGNGDLKTNDYRMNSMVIIDSNVPMAAFDFMARNIQEVIKTEGAADGLGEQTELLYKMANVVGERFAKDYELRSQKGYVSLATVPGLDKPLVFSNVNLKWQPKLKAFYSEGNIGLSNIGRTDINGGFEGFMESRKTEDGASVFHVFLKVSPEAWYYFGFEDNRLMVHSSDAKFNDVISKKTNAGKAKVGEIAFIPGSNDETLAFINRFRKQYYGIDVPYDLSEGAAIKEETTPAPTRPFDTNRTTGEEKKDGGNTDTPKQDPKKEEDKKKEDEDDGF